VTLLHQPAPPLQRQQCRDLGYASSLSGDLRLLVERVTELVALDDMPADDDGEGGLAGLEGP
jgi:hypothetical protein